MRHPRPIRFKLIIEGETMSSVTGTYTITVAGGTTPPNPLAISPATANEPGETVGTPVSNLVATVSGGVPPYTYVVSGLPAGTGLSLSEAPSADGVSGDADVTLSGTPNAADAAASPITLSITATDGAGAAAQLKKLV
jgi:hypothetical protein